MFITLQLVLGKVPCSLLSSLVLLHHRLLLRVSCGSVPLIVFFTFRSGAWNAVSSATSSGADVRVSDSPPLLLLVTFGGHRRGSAFIYFTDVDGGSFWMLCSPTVSAAGGGAYVNTSAPPTQTQGDLWFDTNLNQLKVYDGASFVTTQNEVSGVNSLSGTTPITVDNTDAANPVVAISAATNVDFGSIRIATQAEVNAASATDVAITPATLSAGIENYYTQATKLHVVLLSFTQA